MGKYKHYTKEEDELIRTSDGSAAAMCLLASKFDRTPLAIRNRRSKLRSGEGGGSVYSRPRSTPRKPLPSVFARPSFFKDENLEIMATGRR